MGEGRSLRLEEGRQIFVHLPSSISPLSVSVAELLRYWLFVLYKIFTGLSGLGDHFEIWVFTSIMD